MALIGLEEGLAELRGLIGQDLPRPSAWLTDVTPDAIRHYALGAGDDNPLWCDAAYAARGPYGEVIASPSFLYGVDDTIVVAGLYGYQSLYMGANWEYHRPIRVGTRITRRARLTKMEQKQTRYGGHMILVTSEVTYVDAAGEVLGVNRNLIGRVVPPEGQQSGGIRYQPKDPHAYAAEEISRIRSEQTRYRRRGAVPRYFEEVREGDPVSPLVLGPLTVADFGGHYAGAGYSGALPDSVDKPRQRRRLGDFHEVSHSSGIYRDATGVTAYPSRSHLDGRLAHQLGMPAAFDFGSQRTSWVARLPTDWAGDAGRLSALDVQLRRPIIVGDTIWFHGVVAERRLDSGRGLVKIELWGDNQHGERTTNGSAIVTLPLRA